MRMHTTPAAPFTAPLPQRTACSASHLLVPRFHPIFSYFSNCSLIFSMACEFHFFGARVESSKTHELCTVGDVVSLAFIPIPLAQYWISTCFQAQFMFILCSVRANLISPDSHQRCSRRCCVAVERRMQSQHRGRGACVRKKWPDCLGVDQT